LVIGLVAGLPLILANPTLAALCITWQQPPDAQAKEEVRIAFGTRIPLVPGEYRSWPVSDYPFRVELAAPDGSTNPLPMRNSAALWTGSFIPDRAGQWSVRVTNFEAGLPADRACYERLSIRVAKASATGDIPDASGDRVWWPRGVTVVGVALGLPALAWMLSRRYRAS
jgi:hypothetical protein